MIKKLLAVLSVLVLSGCAQVPAAPAVKVENLQSFYSQELTWVDCGKNLECTKISVPMDYTDLSKSTITIAVNRYWAGKGEPVGELLINPGGPGASGYDYVKNSPESLGTDRLRAQYALVGFDPRGVQNSSSVRCLDSDQLDRFFYEDDGVELGSDQDLRATKERVAQFIAGCVAKTGELLGFVDTESAARDMDIIRALLGEPKLNYLGFSYGTFLGTVYANLFPEQVGRFVLDGAVDPTMDSSVQSITQLKGFDSALRAYLKNCARDSECPLSGNLEENLAFVRDFLRSLEGNPLENSDEPNRPVTVWAAETGMMMALYSADYWTYLNQAFYDAINDRDGTMFQRLADVYNDRDDRGNYTSNINEANIAINCIDSREDSSEEAMREQNEKLLEASPTLGRYWQFGALLCADWPHGVKKTLTEYSAAGAPVIVVVGTTNDPATPYEQAVTLAHKVLKNGFLVTYQGEGHTAYGGESQCVDNAVDDFFLTGKLPATEPKC